MANDADTRRRDEGLHVRCPHCHNAIELVDGDPLSDIPCPSCGSHFHLISGQSTRSLAHEPTQTLGNFELIERVGTGQFGSVWKARDKALDRVVAVKIPREGNVAPEHTEQFLREARAAAQVRHQNIVSMHEVGAEDGSVYLVSDFIEGASLSEWLTGQRYSPREAAQLCIKIADALHEAHEAGVVHRDLKPGNIMMNLEGEPHITDFGLAKRDTGEITMTLDGRVLGTPAYMPPEQARGQGHHADRRADVYSLGVILFELLTGELPFRGDTRMLLVQILRDAPPTPRKLNSRIPRDLETICLKCLEKEPERRYQTAAALGEDLRRFLGGRAIEARPISSIEHSWRWAKRNPGVATLSAVLLLTLFAGVNISTFFALLANNRADELATAVENESKARQEAETAQLETETLAVDMHTERGLLAANSGDAATAMLWFSKAAEIGDCDANRQQKNRLRARNWARETVLPVAAQSIDEPPRQVDFSAGDNWLFIQGMSHSYILDWRRDQFLPWADGIEEWSAGCWNPDGTTFAAGTSDGEVRVYRVPEGETLSSLEHPGKIRSLCYSRDGNLLAIASDVVRVWDTRTERFVSEPWRHPASVYSMAFNRRGDRLVTACGDKKARVFCLGEDDKRSLLFAPAVHVNPLAAPVFVENDQILIMVSEPQKISWMNANSGEVVRDETVDRNVFGFLLSPGGILVSRQAAHLVVLQGQDANIRNLVEPDRPFAVLRHDNGVYDAALDAAGKTLLTVSWDQTARLWSLHDGSLIGYPLQHTGSVQRCALSDNASLIATAQHNGLIRVWRRPQSSVMAPLNSIPMRAACFQLSSDGQLLAPGIEHVDPWQTAGWKRIQVVRTSSGAVAGPELTFDTAIRDSEMCSNNRTLAMIQPSADAGRLLFFDVATGRESTPPIDLPSRPLSVAAHPNEPHVAVLCRGGELLVVDVASGKDVISMKTESSEGAFRNWPRVKYTPNGKNLIALAGGLENAIYVFDAETGKQRFAPIRPVITGGPCRTFAISPSNGLLATGVNGKNAVQVWDLENGNARSAPLPHPGDVYGIYFLAFTPDEKHVMSISKDGHARLWDWQGEQMIGQPMVFPGEGRRLKFVNGGKYVAIASSAADTGSLQVWETQTQKIMAPAIHVPHPVTLEIAAGEKEAFLSSYDGVLYRVNLDGWLSEPGRTIQEYTLLAEMVSSYQIQSGGVTLLTKEQWMQRWRKYSADQREFEVPTLAELLADHLAAAKTLVDVSAPREALAHLGLALAGLVSANCSPRDASKHRARILRIRRAAYALLDQQMAAKRDTAEYVRVCEKLLQDDVKDDEVAESLARVLLEEAFPGEVTNRSDRQASLDERSSPVQDARPIGSEVFSETVRDGTLDGYSALAAAYYLCQKYDSAISILAEGAVGSREGSVASHLLLALSYHELRQADEASRHYEELLEGLRHHGNPGCFEQVICQAMETIGGLSRTETANKLRSLKVEGQIAATTRELQADSQSVKHYLQRGSLYSQRKEHKRAAADYSHAIDLLPVDYRFNHSRSSLLKSLVRTKPSVFEHLSELRPDDPLLPISKGRDLVLQGHFEQAVELYRGAITRVPFCEIWYEYAALLVLVDDMAGYEEFTARAAKTTVAPESPQLFFFLARLASLVPNPVVTTQQLTKWGEAGIANRDWWELHVAGLAHFRAGTDLTESRIHESLGDRSSVRAIDVALNRLVLCLLSLQRGVREEGSRHLRHAEETLHVLEEKKAGERIQETEHDWLELNVLLREAREAIGKSPEPE